MDGRQLSAPRAVRGAFAALALLGAGCRTQATQERERIADSVVAAEQAAAPSAAAAIQWARVDEVPHLRFEGATAVVRDTVYLIGGVGAGDTLSAIRTVDRLDQVGRRWSLGPELPSAVSHVQAAVIGDSTIWIAGGFLGRHGGPPTAEVWRLDRRLGRWVPGPSLPEARGGGALVAIGDTLYYAGGWGNRSGHRSGRAVAVVAAGDRVAVAYCDADSSWRCGRSGA